MASAVVNVTASTCRGNRVTRRAHRAHATEVVELRVVAGGVVAACDEDAVLATDGTRACRRCQHTLLLCGNFSASELSQRCCVQRHVAKKSLCRIQFVKPALQPQIQLHVPRNMCRSLETDACCTT